jgi:hypothetical protein
MALVSPGVEVTIIDESQYLPAPTNTIPFVLLATAQDKANPTGTGVASGTTAANAGKLFQVTSQRDLVALYGNPFFYTTANGTPIQGYELNEYGLLAAYSALGITNRVYCLRADIDLASLVGQTGRPTGNPANGTYWLDTTTSTWGIYEFDSVTGTFALQTPIVITDPDQISGSYPINSLGVIGSYAVIAIPTYDWPSQTAAGQFFYKNDVNQWVRIGTAEWLNSWPTVQGTLAPGSLTMNNELTITLSGMATVSVSVSSSPDNTVADLVNQINTFANGGNLGSLFAASVNGKLVLYSRQTGGDITSSVPYEVTIGGTAGLLTQLGISAGTYYQPIVSYGTSAQQPLWQQGQSYPAPTGSVWIKIGTAGSGLNSVVSEFNSTTANWVAKTVSYATADWSAIGSLDSSGGKNIPAGTVYVQYDYDTRVTGGIIQKYPATPIYYWERLAEGPTVVTGTNTSPSFTNGPYDLLVQISVPGTSTLGNYYTVVLGDNTDAEDFVNAWNTAAIPYTIASLTSAGAIQLTHTQGGVIVLSDILWDTTGVSSGLLEEAGFVPGSTLGAKYGPAVMTMLNAGQGPSYPDSTTSGVGSGFEMTIRGQYQTYYFETDNFVDAGGGYAVGDTITINGSYLGGSSGTNNLVVAVTSVDAGNGNAVTGIAYVSGTAALTYQVQLSNWVEFDMTANEGSPTQAPDDLTNWFYSVVDEVDIMVNTTSGWYGYRNVSYDNNGFPLPSGINTTDPNGPIVSATKPTTQSDGTALSYGDLWIDTSDVENYPIINRWQSVSGVNQWVRIDNTDQTSSKGVLFADARWATNGTTNPANDPIPSIVSLLTSNYLDLGAPDEDLYPVGMLLFNTRRSGYNVKQYRVNYFNTDRFPDQPIPDQTDAWVTISGNQSNGSPYMGRKAQRAVVVKALRAAIDTNSAIRDEDNPFNLTACPNYPELQPNMVVLNNDRGNTGFIVGDTPMRLPDDATAIQAWATNAAGATSTGEEGLVTRDTYLGLFYPSGITSDLNGNLVAVPASHMMLRTILRNDTVAYPWFAPAGTRRGIIDNATSIGYIDSATGEFQVIKTRIGIRDVLYTNQINPMVFFTGNGLLNYGNKVSFNSQSALDRINVARLIAYIRRQLTIAARPFVFEPNDAITRQQVTSVIQTLFIDLVAKRGIYDYLVVCDESNNTPARIDRNELWVDIAIEPVKAIEFIYIPVRVLNTGEIAALG